MNSKTIATVAQLGRPAIESVPEKKASRLAAENSFAISRADIEFFNIASGLVAMQIKVTNHSATFSTPDTLKILSAPFGAFVPWRPLADIALPALAPGAARYVRWRAAVQQAVPLGSPGGVGPRDLLTAFGLGDEPPEKPSTNGSEKLRRNRGADLRASGPARLPPGLMELLLQDTPHWAGNINVLVGRTDVETHRARALRVYPGRLNLAWFIVGGGPPDAYAFKLCQEGTGWAATLFDMTSRETLAVAAGDDNTAIAPGEWVDTCGSRTMLLALRVPRKCEATSIAVHVVQKSTQREAVVEFSLDPKAAGRGCYTA